MRVLIFILFLVLIFEVKGQSKKGLYVGLSQTADYSFRNTESILDVGTSFKHKKGSIKVFLTYAYGGVFNYNAVSKPDAFHKNFKPYNLDYHLLGGGMKYRFKTKKAVYYPTLKLTITTEMGSRYRGKGLELGYEQNSKGNYFPLFSPTDHVYPHVQLSHQNNGENKLLYYHTYNYISTPLAGSFFFGNEFRLFNGFFINLELGYMFRAFRYYHNKWLPEEKEPSVDIVEIHRLKETSNGKSIFEHYFEFGIGVNYTFSFKPKPSKPK